MRRLRAWALHVVGIRSPLLSHMGVYPTLRWVWTGADADATPSKRDLEWLAPTRVPLLDLTEWLADTARRAAALDMRTFEG